MRFLTPSEVDQIAELNAAGWKQLHIANKLGISQAAVFWRLRKMGRVSSSMKKLDVEKVSELYASGMSQPKIAKHFGVNPSNVSTFMKRHSIPVRSVEERLPKGPANHAYDPNPSYGACHQRLRKLKGRPKYCSMCGKNDPKAKYHWANLTKKYEDPNDYVRLCQHCHFHMDHTYKLDLNEVLAMRAKGMKQWEIAKVYGCDRATISLFLRNHGYYGWLKDFDASRSVGS